MWEPDSVTQRGSSLATINHVQTLEGGWSNRRQEKLREAACCHSIAYFLNKQFVFSKEEHFFCFFCWGIRVLLLIICTRCGMLQADWPEDGPTVPKLSALLNHWHILTSWRHQLTTCIWTYIDILTTYHSWHNNMTTTIDILWNHCIRFSSFFFHAKALLPPRWRCWNSCNSGTSKHPVIGRATVP